MTMPKLHFWVRFSLLLWVLTMISLPIVGWTWGQTALLRGMSLAVCIQAGAVMVILVQASGWLRAAGLFGRVAVLSYLAELLGSSTGFPFGPYHYTGLLQPQLANVPLLIPLAWWMMLPPAWAVARAIAPQGRVRFVLLSAAAFTAWDLFLDPQMVAWGFWVWEIPGQYFGIPWVNYLGWFVVSALITLVLHPGDLPVFPLTLVYGLTWSLQSIGQALFWGQPGPALVGFLACGGFVLLAVDRWRRAHA